MLDNKVNIIELQFGAFLFTKQGGTVSSPHPCEAILLVLQRRGLFGGY